MITWCYQEKRLVTDMKEKKIETYLTRRVEECGGMCIKFPPLFYAGFPDRLIFLPRGVFALVETKATDGSPRLLQRKIHAKLRALGFRVEVLSSYEQVDEFIIST